MLFQKDFECLDLMEIFASNWDQFHSHLYIYGYTPQLIAFYIRGLLKGLLYGAESLTLELYGGS